MRRFLKRFRNSIIGKLLKFLLNLVKWTIELLIIAIALVIIVQKVTDNEKSFLGYRMFHVATGSMVPEYNIGDVLISKEIEPEDVKIGDDLVYLGEKGDFKNKIITHRVIQIEQDENGDYLFHTQGIASDREDPVVNEDQIYGIVIENNAFIAWLSKIIANEYGIYFLVILPIMLYVFITLIKVQDKKWKEEDEKEELEKQKENEQNKN